VFQALKQSGHMRGGAHGADGYPLECHRGFPPYKLRRQRHTNPSIPIAAPRREHNIPPKVHPSSLSRPPPATGCRGSQVWHDLWHDLARATSRLEGAKSPGKIDLVTMSRLQPPSSPLGTPCPYHPLSIVREPIALRRNLGVCPPG
jgi:hypothetical protein